MVEQFTGYKSKNGGLYLTREAATREEVLDDLCEIMPEFALIRPRLDSNLRALAIAMGPMLDLLRVPSDCPDHGEHQPPTLKILSHDEARKRGFPTGPEMARKAKSG